MKIAAVIISQNSSKTLKACLDSVAHCVDEIILVDSFSQDNTIQIASSYPNLNCIQRHFDNYIGQKNYANELTSAEYILSLDSDEYISKELQSFIKNRNYSSYEALIFPRKNLFQKKEVNYGLWGRDRKLRIWKKIHGRWGGTQPHESLILEGSIQSEFIPLPFYHYAAESMEEVYHKSKKYGLMAAKCMDGKPKISLILSLVLSPPFKWIKSYVFLGGWRDGIIGWYLSKSAMMETYFKYKFALTKPWEKQSK